MPDDTNIWIIFALAALGVTAAIVAFVRTPRERRYRSFTHATLEEQLRNCPESAQAVIIKGDKKQALVRSAPFILIGIVLFGFSWWIENTGYSACAHLLGINAAYISMLIFFYGLPLIFLAVSILYLETGIKIIKTGYSPPLDSVVFRDTIAKKGAVSTIRGVVILVFPVFALFVVYLGNNAFTAVTGGKNMHEIVEMLEAKCE